MRNHDRVKENGNTPGTATLLNTTGAVSGFVTFASKYSVGHAFAYLIEDGTAWEIGTASYNGGTQINNRVFKFSSTGSILSLSSAYTISVIAPAETRPAMAWMATVPAATGNYSFAMGEGAVASGAQSMAFGRLTTASQTDSIAIGTQAAATAGADVIAIGRTATPGSGGIAIGLGAITGSQGVSIGNFPGSTGTYGVAIGKDGYDATKRKSISIGGGSGRHLWLDGQRSWGSLQADGQNSFARGARFDIEGTVITADATPTELFFCDQGTQLLLLLDSMAVRFRITILAAKTGSLVYVASIDGAAKRAAGAGTIALVGTPVTTVIGNDSGMALTFTVTADTTNGSLKVTVTGQAATTITWIAIARVDYIYKGLP